MAGDISFSEEKIVKVLLQWGVIRGSDATGIASVNRHNNHEFRLSKDIGVYYHLEDHKSFDKVWQGTNQCYIGHNRSKTVGDNIRRNAHPFIIDDIVGAHNGTLDYQNKNRLEAGMQFKTDSEAIMNNICVHGIEDTIKRLDKSTAYALTWYDRRDNTINLLRNDQRPLIYTIFKEGKTLAWASEFGMLSAALGREGIKVSELKFLEVTPNHWLSWKIPEHSTEKLSEPSRKKLENYEYKYQSYDYTKKNGSTTNTTNGRSVTQPGFNHNTDSMYGIDDNDPDYSGMEYKGMYVGWVPKEQPAKTFVERSIVDKALDKVKGLMGGSSPEAKASIMTAVDVTRKKAREFAEKGGIIPVSSPTLISQYKGQNLEVWRNTETGKWTYIEYNVVRNSWEQFLDHVIPPLSMPYTMLDINSNHIFKHVGKGVNKRIYYKGYQGQQLDRPAFEVAVRESCAQCQRVPEWGNKVFFFSKDNEFLCEYCERTPGLLQKCLDASKASQQAA